MDDDPNIYSNPHRVNDPVLIYIFPAVQVLPALLILMAGIFFDQLKVFFYISVGWFVLAHYIITDDSVKDFVHKLWRMGLVDALVTGSKRIPNPLVKRFF